MPVPCWTNAENTGIPIATSGFRNNCPSLAADWRCSRCHGEACGCGRRLFQGAPETATRFGAISQVRLLPVPSHCPSKTCRSHRLNCRGTVGASRSRACGKHKGKSYGNGVAVTFCPKKVHDKNLPLLLVSPLHLVPSRHQYTRHGCHDLCIHGIPFSLQVLTLLLLPRPWSTEETDQMIEMIGIIG